MAPVFLFFIQPLVDFQIKTTINRLYFNEKYDILMIRTYEGRIRMYQPQALAENIRRYRLIHGLTQGQLAEKLYVTSQNVSKWENGKSYPDLENLCKLAGILSVSTDQLLSPSDTEPKESLFVAIDGGGTKTEFVLYTEQGQVLKRVQLGGTNPNTFGVETSKAILKTGLEQLLAENRNIAVIYAGISGCKLIEPRNALRSFLKQTYPGVRCEVQSDILNVIYSAPVGDRCIASICGTGSVVYAKTPQQLERLGGWGYLWESGCSGYDFGRDALRAALAAKDKNGPDTLLLDMVEARIGGNPCENLNKIYQLDMSGIASFASLVFEALAQGDSVAQAILEKNVSQLALLINTAAERYDCGNDVVIAGGLLNQKQILEPAFKQKLAPHLHLIFSEMPQICGAAVGGCRLHGNLQSTFRDEFYKNYRTFLEENNNAKN